MDNQKRGTPMSLFDPIRNYCERSGPELWDEPINVLSNGAFFIAAWALWRMYKNSSPQREVSILIFLLVLIGCGSTLFHTFANGLTMIGDVVPIALFTFYYLWVGLRKLLQLQRHYTVTTLSVFALVAFSMSYVPAALRFNGSVDYFPCLGTLFLLGITIINREHAAAVIILKAVGWFTISIFFRSLDMQLCASIPIGTHFIWHSLNGYVLYLLVRAVMIAHADDSNIKIPLG